MYVNQSDSSVSNSKFWFLMVPLVWSTVMLTQMSHTVTCSIQTVNRVMLLTHSYYIQFHWWLVRREQPQTTSYSNCISIVIHQQELSFYCLVTWHAWKHENTLYHSNVIIATILGCYLSNTPGSLMYIWCTYLSCHKIATDKCAADMGDCCCCYVLVLTCTPGSFTSNRTYNYTG